MNSYLKVFTSYAAFRNSVLLIVLSFGSLSVGNSQTPGVELSTTGFSYGQTNFNTGFKFSLTNSISITSLGVFDRGDDMFGGTHIINIYTSTGTVLATATVDEFTVGTLLNGFRYIPLGTPVTLLSGQSYVIAAHYPDDVDLLERYDAPFSDAVAAPGISLIEPVFIFGTGFPSNSMADRMLFGPNFLFSRDDSLSSAAPVPTLSQWGILIFGLSLLALGLVVVYNVQTSRQLVLAGYGSTESHSGLNLGRFNIPFDVEKYKVALLWSGGLAIAGFITIYLIWGKIITDDIIGMSISAPLVAYVLYLMKEK